MQNKYVVVFFEHRASICKKSTSERVLNTMERHIVVRRECRWKK